MKHFLFVGVMSAVCVPFFVYAFVATSTSFRIIDPVMEVSGGYATSTTYQANQSVGQIAIGTSTGASLFRLAGGFLYFPRATSPVVSATAGNGQAELSWTASQGFLGWTASGYNVGRATASGGPYVYSASLGNVTSSIRTGLTNGTAYYFVIRAEDPFGNSIATSSQVSVTPVAPETPSAPPARSSGGGGGGGGGIGLPSAVSETKVILKGRAYPAAAVTVFKDGATVATPKADANGNFEITVSVAGGIYTFSLYAIDSENRRSLTSSFTTNVPVGRITTISDIVIAPTIGADKSQVKIGNEIKFFGAAYPVSSVSVIINSEEPYAAKIESDKFGRWLYALKSDAIERGDHTIKSQTVTQDGLISPFSESLAFRVGNSDVAFAAFFKAIESQPSAGPACNKNGDINNDGKVNVNIVDFSIMLFFWNQRNPKNPCADINRDGVVNLFDFSIMLFWWTG